MFPTNVSLLPHLRKHCCGSKIKFASQEAKMFPKEFRDIFVAETMFPSFPTCFQMFSARETLFSRLGKFKYFKTIVQM